MKYTLLETMVVIAFGNILFAIIVHFCGERIAINVLGGAVMLLAFTK